MILNQNVELGIGYFGQGGPSDNISQPILLAI